MIVQPMNWRIYAVILENSCDIATFWVCTNIGVKAFCPSDNRPLPLIVQQFLAECQDNLLDFGSCKVFLEDHVEGVCYG